MERFTGDDVAQAQPLDRLNFDLLRALLAARQGASPTVRALGAMQPRGTGDGLATRVALFAGAAHTLPDSVRSGAFRPRVADDTVSTDGERHV